MGRKRKKKEAKKKEKKAEAYGKVENNTSRLGSKHRADVSHFPTGSTATDHLSEVIFLINRPDRSLVTMTGQLDVLLTAPPKKFSMAVVGQRSLVAYFEQVAWPVTETKSYKSHLEVAAESWPPGIGGEQSAGGTQSRERSEIKDVETDQSMRHALTKRPEGGDVRHGNRLQG